MNAPAERGPRSLPAVAALGGGHGLYASLMALRRITDRVTAVVTVADDGGSSGRLRQEFGCLPPGDLRMALTALCQDDSEGRQWAELLHYRFGGSGSLAGHSIGNLLILGLWQQLGDPVAGLDMVGHLLGTCGRVLPMSLQPLSIEADVIGMDPARPDEISTLVGQAAVAKTRADVLSIRLVPPDAPACGVAVDAVRQADFIVLGPGSWFTSVMPHLMVPELSRAISTPSAKRILTLNIAPAGETDGFSASRHIELLAEHAPWLRLDHVIADVGFASTDPHLEAYCNSLGASLTVADVAMRDGSPRHDPLRLAAAYAEVMGM